MSVNEITGDPIRTDVPSNKFKSGWDAIWGKLDKVIEAIAEDSGEGAVRDEDVLKDYVVIGEPIEPWTQEACDEFEKALSEYEED
jgi:hypothetical protein